MIEVLKQALDALKDLLDQTEPPPDKNCSCHIAPPCSDCVDYSGVRYAIEQANKTITAIKEALAQPEQEPVVWGTDWGRAGDIPCVSIIKRLPNGGIQVLAVEYAPYSYTTPPQRTEPESVQQVGTIGHIGNGSTTLTRAIAPLLSKAQAQAQPEQEPVALPCCGYADSSAIKWNPYSQVVQCHNCGQIYTHPPQRTFVGLTNGEIEGIKLKACGNVFSAIMFTNDRLEEKNT
jgi:hypothetical protein